MFENIISYIINRALSDYIANINVDQLKVDLFSGDAELRDLKVREDALEQLGLPLRVKHSYIGRVLLRVPVKRPLVDSWYASIDDVFVLIVPAIRFEYDAKAETALRRRRRRAELERFEALLAEQANRVSVESGARKVSENEQFWEDVAVALLRNLHAEVRNVHIRYEDAVIDPQRPLAFGVTFTSAVYTSQSDADANVDDKDSNDPKRDEKQKERVNNVMRKTFTLNGLSVYLHINASAFSAFERSEDVVASLAAGISQQDASAGISALPSGAELLLDPLTVAASLHFDLHPERRAFETSRCDLRVRVGGISARLTRQQLIGIALNAAEVNRLLLETQFAKYGRPSTAFTRSTAANWWRYAYRVVLNEHVRKRVRLSWASIRSHLTKCHEYRHLYALKLTRPKGLGDDERRRLEELELDELDVFNVMLLRQQAALQLASTKRRKPNWFTSLFAASAPPETLEKETAATDSEQQQRSSARFVGRIADELSRFSNNDDMRALYALVYEQEYAAARIPPDYFGYQFALESSRVRLTMVDDTGSEPVSICTISLLGTSANLRYQPETDSVRLNARLRQLEMRGLPRSLEASDRDGRDTNTVTVPVILTSRRFAESIVEIENDKDNENQEDGDKQVPFIEVEFSTNAPGTLSSVENEVHVDFTLQASVQSAVMVYDAATVSALSTFARTPLALRVAQLSDVLAELQERGEMTIRRLLRRQLTGDIRVALEPSRLILPSNGTYCDHQPALVVSFGSWQLLSVPLSGADRQVRLAWRSARLKQKEQTVPSSFRRAELDTALYDPYELTVSSFSVFVLDRAIDKDCELQHHLFAPLDLNVTYKRCVALDDDRFATNRLNGRVGLLRVVVSSELLRRTAAVVLSLGLFDTVARFRADEAVTRRLLELEASYSATEAERVRDLLDEDGRELFERFYNHESDNLSEQPRESVSTDLAAQHHTQPAAARAESEESACVCSHDAELSTSVPGEEASNDCRGAGEDAEKLSLTSVCALVVTNPRGSRDKARYDGGDEREQAERRRLARFIVLDASFEINRVCFQFNENLNGESTPFLELALDRVACRIRVNYFPSVLRIASRIHDFRLDDVRPSTSKHLSRIISVRPATRNQWASANATAAEESRYALAVGFMRTRTMTCVGASLGGARVCLSVPLVMKLSSSITSVSREFSDSLTAAGVDLGVQDTEDATPKRNLLPVSSASQLVGPAQSSSFAARWRAVGCELLLVGENENGSVTVDQQQSIWLNFGSRGSLVTFPDGSVQFDADVDLWRMLLRPLCIARCSGVNVNQTKVLYSPSRWSIAGGSRNLSGDSLALQLNCSNVSWCVSPGLISLLSRISTQFAQLDDSVVKMLPTDVCWQPRPVRPQNSPITTAWYLQPPASQPSAATAKSKTETAASGVADKTLIALSLHLPKIEFRFEPQNVANELESRPLLRVRAAVNAGQISTTRAGSLTIDLRPSVIVSYFNETLAGWEQLLEKIETTASSGHGVSDPNFLPATFHFLLRTNPLTDGVVEPDVDTDDDVDMPRTSLKLSTKLPVNWTLTRRAIDVLTQLATVYGESFKKATMQPGNSSNDTRDLTSRRSELPGTIRMRNETGVPLHVAIADRGWVKQVPLDASAQSSMPLSRTLTLQRRRRSLSRTRSYQRITEPERERERFVEIIDSGGELALDDVEFAIAFERARGAADAEDTLQSRSSSRTSSLSLWRKRKLPGSVGLSRLAQDRSATAARRQQQTSFTLAANVEGALTEQVGVSLGNSDTRVFCLSLAAAASDAAKRPNVTPTAIDAKFRARRGDSERQGIKRSSSASRDKGSEKAIETVWKKETNEKGKVKTAAAANFDGSSSVFVSMHVQRDLLSRVITFRSRLCITNRMPISITLLCASVASSSQQQTVPPSGKPLELASIEPNTNYYVPLAFAESCIKGALVLLVRAVAADRSVEYCASQLGLAAGRSDRMLLTSIAKQGNMSCCIIANRIGFGPNDPRSHRRLVTRVVSRRAGEQKNALATREVGMNEYVHFSLSPNVVVSNQLAISIDCIVAGSDEQTTIEPGEKSAMLSAVLGQSTLRFRIVSYMQADWDASWRLLDNQRGGVYSLTFVSRNGYHELSHTLSMFAQTVNGVLHLSVFAAYWFVNKTGLKLKYTLHDGTQKRVRLAADADECKLIMCSVNVPAADRKSSSVNSSATADSPGAPKQSAARGYVQVGESDLSDGFALDGAGTSQRLACTANKQRYELSVRIKFSSFQLTKTVTFEPYFIVVNQTALCLEFRERDTREWLPIEPERALGFWPKRVGKQMLTELRLAAAATSSTATSSDGRLDTAVFAVNEPHTSIVRLNQTEAVRVDVRCTDENTSIVFEAYQRGMCPALLVNDSSLPAYYREQCSPPKQMQCLEPGHQVLFTWEPFIYQPVEAPFARKLELQIGGQSRLFTSEMTHNEAHSGRIGDANAKTSCFWVSFVDDVERVLLLTDSARVVSDIQQTSFERPDIKCELKLASISVSLVDETYPREIAYIHLAGGSPTWQVKDPREPNRRYQPLQGSWISTLEAEYTRFLDARSTAPASLAVRDERSRVGYEFEIVPPGVVFMTKPVFGYVRRSTQSGVWLVYRASTHRRDLHLKVHHVQVDNQLHAANYPVAFAPIRSRSNSSSTTQTDVKPLIELMVLSESRLQSSALHFKYFKVLVQECAVKLDRNLLLALVNLFSRPHRERDALTRLRTEIDGTRKSLYESHMAGSGSAAGRRLYFDYLHVSPLKVTLTFSMVLDKTDRDSVQRTHREARDRANEDWFDAFFTGVGVVGEVADGVVIKLGYFERRCELQTASRIVAEVGSYYTKQLLKQVYVFVFGLPILGDPYGVLRGFASGVQTFFYEPLEGAVLGPQELAHGVASGTKALVGGTVGGVAGALSKMTGAIGSGIAKVSFDDEDLRKRRIVKAKTLQAQAPASYVQSGGQQVVQGVISAFTGVVTKPMDGAKKDGVSGAMKGLARGAFGLITQPVVGFTSLISDTLQAVKTATDTVQIVHRARLPRYLSTDCLVRPYSTFEAEALVLLQDIEDGKYLLTDTYLAHCAAGPESKQMLLVTDLHVFLLEPTALNVMRKWMARAVTFEDLEQTPRFVRDEGIVFLYKADAKQRLLDKKQPADFLEMRDSTVSERMCEIMAAVMDVSTLSAD